MNGYECGTCGVEPCVCAETKAREEEAKASTRLKRLEEDTNVLFKVLIKPKGLRLRLLRWLYPEIVKVIDSLRRCYWSGLDDLGEIENPNERDDAFGPFV